MTDGPGYTPDDLLRGLSLPRRAGYAAAGLAGASAAGVIGALWATEPGPLPVGTRLAFAAMILVGLAWAAFAAWTLLRRPLFALDRVVAAALGMAFSALTAVGTVAGALSNGSATGAAVGAALGGVLTGVSGLLLFRAVARRKVLRARMRDLGGG
ncbi:transmembrane transport protein [Sphaerisporangium sp. TRM90804]|uniref:transmembrane transport protein n=1 Tax=Sphaerisporangium sp. TRM90804 TaxID=3031113 RepID=UPI002446E845|nr:transmembrane transport protein [Sphaerisporangium sp. TRM90804]MDH2428509.1 transmembrane transport protein [Sphaerisporangium sp. TRM90804]